MRSQPRALIRLVQALNQLADLTHPSLGQPDIAPRNHNRHWDETHGRTRAPESV